MDFNKKLTKIKGDLSEKGFDFKSKTNITVENAEEFLKDTLRKKRNIEDYYKIGKIKIQRYEIPSIDPIDENRYVDFNLLLVCNVQYSDRPIKKEIGEVRRQWNCFKQAMKEQRYCKTHSIGYTGSRYLTKLDIEIRGNLELVI